VPYSNRLAAGLRESRTEAPSAELAEQMASRQPLVFALVATAVIVLIIALMVFKPTLW
jgi:hypothetical protein